MENLNINEIVKEATIIDVENICKQFSNATTKIGKQTIAQNLIYRKYVPIMEKRFILSGMFGKAMMDDNGVIYIDQFLYTFNLKIAILTMYTSLDLTHNNKNEVNEEESKYNIFDDYDMLRECGLFQEIMDSIPVDEIQEINYIYNCFKEDFNNKHKTPDAYLFDLFNRIETVLTNGGTSMLNQLIELAKDGNLIDNNDVINANEFLSETI